MRLIFTILLIGLFNAEGQIVINASAPYRPRVVAANLLLDDYPNAVAAYSLRKLDKDYTGAAIRVRKDTTGQPEQDIGFTASGDLDTAALKSFLNARSGFITTWYDQSGSSQNATQTTQANQPRIANLGVIDRQNGKPAIFYDGSNDRFATGITSMDLNNGDNISAFNVVRTSVINDTKVILSKGDDPPPIGPATDEDGWDFRISSTAKIQFVGWQNANYMSATSTTNETANAQRLFSWFANGGSLTTNVNIFGNGTEFGYTRGGTTTTLDNTNYVINIGAQLYAGVYYYHWSGTMQEIVLYNADKRTDRTGIENNINDYYNIYWNGDFTGLLDTYGSSAAAYSLRNLSSTYTGPLIRVRKDTTGQPEMDIYGDYYGNLDTVGLKSFLNARSGFVTTWYDQSGQSRNATQTTQANQPRIANLGVIDRKNGKPMMDFDGSNDHIQVPSSTATFKFLHDGTSNFIAAVSHIDADLGCCQALIETTNASSANVGTEILHTVTFIFADVVVRGQTNTYAVENASGANAVSTNQFLLTMNRDADNATAANRSEIFINNGAAIKNNTRTSSVSAANATGNLTFGATSNGSVYRLNGGIQEILIYSSDQSSNRTGIRDNINTHYNIYTP